MEGNPYAQIKLAAQYADQPKRQLYWYKQAARQGVVTAKFHLAYHYMQGIGSEVNKSEAIYWWAQAAEQDHTLSQYNLGRAYYEGIGVERNTRQALIWLKKAAEKGNKQSIKALELVDSNSEATPTEQTNDNAKGDGSIETSTASPEVSHIFMEPEMRSLKIASLNASDMKSCHVSSGKGSSKNNWEKVQCDKKLGAWSYKKFIEIKDADNSKTATFIGNNVRARFSPSIKYGNIITEVKKGSSFTVLQQKDSWVQVELDQFNGWVQKKGTVKRSEKPTATEEEVSISVKQRNYAYTFSNPKNDNQWLFNAKTTGFTLILDSVDSDENLDSVLSSLEHLPLGEVKILSTKRQKVEWKHVLIGNFDSKEQADAFSKENKLNPIGIIEVELVRQQRCSAWKKTIPIPKKLKTYCLAAAS